MRIPLTVATPLIAMLLYSASHASSLPSRSSGNADNYGNSSANSNKTMNAKDTKSSAANNKIQEATVKIFENYQHCYATLISDFVGAPMEEITARKVSIKKFCRSISQVKYQKKFSQCYNTNLQSGNDLDTIIAECLADNDKPEK